VTVALGTPATVESITVPVIEPSSTRAAAGCADTMRRQVVAQSTDSRFLTWGGGIDHKRSIIETKGSGLAFFDYDNDGWIDIYLTNGNRLDTTWPPGNAPTSHLYKNNHDITFTDFTSTSGLGNFCTSSESTA
jgi:hypothetical protein